MNGPGQKVGIGVIGCGNIAPAYFKGMGQFPILELLACADLDESRASAMAKEFSIPKACSVQELLADKAIDLVVNLTVPKAHASVNQDIIKAGKSLYVEKPWAVSRAEGLAVLASAAGKDIRLGCAPDTFLGGGIQTARLALDEGAIGRPVAATAFMMCPGHESWHPSPEFYYETGGGPLFDMGPYYLTALVNLLGPVRAVSGVSRATWPTRLITSRPKRGKVVAVETPTHIAGILEFASGAIGNIIMSFDIAAHQLPWIEIYGSEGSLAVPDPNTFGGSVKISRPGTMVGWSEIKIRHGYTDNMRGIGPADMAHAMRSGRPHRASGDLGCHVLDIMAGILEASEQGRRLEIKSAVGRPAMLPLGLQHGELD